VQGSGRVQFEVTEATFTWKETTKITAQDNVLQAQKSEPMTSRK
jgi:hypothetical protein